MMKRGLNKITSRFNVGDKKKKKKDVWGWLLDIRMIDNDNIARDASKVIRIGDKG